MLESWTRGVIRHRIVVVAVWVVIGIIGLIAGFNLNNHLTTSLAVPGTESAKADKILRTHFDENVEGTFTVIVPFKNATEAQIKLLAARIYLVRDLKAYQQALSWSNEHCDPVLGDPAFSF